MKLKLRKINYLQEGGQIPAEEPMEEEVPVGQPQEAAPQEQDPMMVMAQLAVQGLQNNDCEALKQMAEMFIQLIQEAQQGGGAPQEEPQGEPVYRAGGKIAYRIRK